MNKNIKIVVFDLDDTIYPELDYVKSGLKAVANFLEKKYDLMGFYKESTEVIKSGKFNNKFEIALSHLGVKSNKKLIEEMIKCYDSHSPKIRLYKDFKSIIEFLDNKYTLSIITDGIPLTQKNKIKALNIESLFKVIIYTNSFGIEYQKPSQKSFVMIENIFNVNGKECIYIADNVKKDFLAPNKLGWISAQIKRKEGIYREEIPETENHKPQIIVNNLLDMKEIF